MKNTIKFYNDCKEGQKPKYFILHTKKQKLLSSVFSSKKYFEENKKIDDNLGHKFISGELSDFTRPFEIVELELKGANLRGNKGEHYLEINPFLKN